MNMQHTGGARRFILSQAQLAVLTELLLGGELILNQVGQSDLGIDQAQLHAAEAALFRRGWLQRLPDGSTAIADEPAAVLATTIVPRRVAIVQTRLPDGEQPAVNFSWAGDRIVRNEMNVYGQHVFSVLHAAAVVDDILAAAGVPQAIPAATGDVPTALETLVANMQALTMLLVVEQPAQPKPVVRNLSWLRAGGGLWLVSGEQASGGSDRQVDRAGLRQAIAASLDSAAD